MVSRKKNVNTKRKAVHDAASDQPKLNNKGEIISWSATSEDGKLLKMLVENSCITMAMTAGQARDKYQMFNKYAYSTFSSALTNAKKALEKELDSKKKKEDVKACRNDEAEEYDEDEFEEEDDDFDYSVGLSRMSINEDDDVTIDTRRSIGKSVSFSVKSGATNLKKYSRKTVSGVAVGHNKGSVGIALALTYVIDYWHDKSPRQRASIQIQMLSGDAMQLQRVSYRVSTSCDEFVVSLPKSRFMGCPKAAFETYVLSNTNNDDKEKHKRILEYHPKTAARRLQLNAINKGGNVMELRIKLQHKFSLDFASVASNDPYFYGDKFVTYPDGSTHLIVELVSDEDKHSSPNKAAAPIFHVPGSVSVPSVGGDDNMSFHSHMDMSVGSRRSMKSTRTSNTSHSHRSHRSARSVPIINAASPAVASRASKYRKNEYGERAAAAREGPVETVSDEHSL